MSRIPSEFAVWKELLASTLTGELEGRVNRYNEVHALGPDTLKRLLEFSVAGKMIRGGLVCLGATILNAEVDDRVVRAGAAVELFQSALLVHDDIMDRDEARRGSDSIYHQYEKHAEAAGIHQARHIGESLGICAGDIAFFIAFEMLASLDIGDSIKSRISALSSRELQYVGIAQMADVYRGAQNDLADAEHADDLSRGTLRVYLYKTGRYTFSLPLMIGAILAGAPEAIVETLEGLGEEIGVLFQIKDDELGLYGDQTTTGKPVGSDVREGKKTIYYAELVRRVEADDRRRLGTVFGNAAASEQEIAWVKRLIESSGAKRRVEEIVDEYASLAAETIVSLESINDHGRAMLKSLLDYNMSRVR